MTEVERSNELFIRREALDYALKLHAGGGRPTEHALINSAKHFENYLKGENNVSRSNK